MSVLELAKKEEKDFSFTIYGTAYGFYKKFFNRNGLGSLLDYAYMRGKRF